MLVSTIFWVLEYFSSSYSDTVELKEKYRDGAVGLGLFCILVDYIILEFFPQNLMEALPYQQGKYH